MEVQGKANLRAVTWITALYLWMFLEVTLTAAFDIHITDTHEVGSVIFHTNVGPGWVYVFSPGPSSGRHSPRFASSLLGVDGNTGDLVLLEKPNCDRIIRNPFNVYIEARTAVFNPPSTSSNFTLVPLTVYVHGNKETCFKYNRQSVRHPHRKADKTLHVSAELITSFQDCLPKGTPVLTVSEYMPASFTASCLAHFKSAEVTPFHLDHQHGDLTTTDTVCLTWPYVTILATVRLKCDVPKGVFHIPLKIVLYGSPVNPKQRSRRGLTNSPPSFEKQSYRASVPEEQNAGYPIVQVTATDPDSDEAGSLTYSLQATRDFRSENMFTIDPTSGQVSTTQKLDRESIDKHYFMVVATDNGKPKQSSMAALTIQVDDVNDHTPTFENSLYAQSVSESVTIGTTILTIRASDGDFGNNGDITYKILNPSGANSAFYIDQNSGSIVTKQGLDRERMSSYSLRIQAADKALVTERKSSTATVEITVLDENDNKPQFSQSSYTVDVREDIDPSGGPIIEEVKATDADAGNNAVIRYTITGGNSMETFSIDANTGQIAVQRSLDFETLRNFRLNIRAQDTGDPPKSNSTTVLVRVIDVNDNSPRFYTSLYQESVLENVPKGYGIIKVQAFDPDDGMNSELVYTLKDTPKNLPMEIDASTGQLTTNRKLDREEQARYSFGVEAADRGTPSRSATASIQVTIRDVNDNAPVFEPRMYNEAVSEEASPGHPVVTVTATDADSEENARVTYTITSGNIKGAFNIISQMGHGLIAVGRTLNYKDQNRYILTVTASDPGGQLDTCTVFINVTDANTFRPVFIGAPYHFRVDEDVKPGSTVYKVMATDGDVGENARISYSIGYSEIFEINPQTGDLLLKAPLDRESTAGYTLSVTATDHGRPPKSDTTDIEILVNDVNDNFPKFLQETYNGLVPEDAVVGTSILTISATDDDQGLSGRVRYTFENGNSGDGDFMIDPTLGILRTAKELDREKVAQYQLKAFAVDRGPVQTEKSTSVIITIQVDDVNDNKPQFQPSEPELFIPENSPVGSTVGVLEAIDPDDGINAEVEYNIVGGPDANSFSLITRKNEPAVVTTLIELDYEGGKREYSITVRARSFHLISDAKVTIRVQDVNDNMPQLKDFTIIFNNYKNYFPPGDIGRIPAHDPDVSDELRYSFLSGNEANLLHLDRITGMIRLNSRLNSDVPTNGTLRVSVTDGINEVRANCFLYVRLVTEEMLNNSITVRLNKINQMAFLSSLYERFLLALAAIVPTTEDNIFIFNIKDDTDVVADILNISFSVRRSIEESADVFHSPQFLRERVYLQRVLLAKLSTLEVLPFDDNLCLREPCLNFEECIGTLKFDNASGFISSDTMLFRPIYPLNTMRCECPRGFTGMDAEYVCDTEVNLCYSSPCGQNGTCIRREGGYTCKCRDGFTGDQCQFARHHRKYDQCPENVCKGAARCMPLIKEGFRCELCPANGEVIEGVPGSSCRDCKHLPYHTDFCELTTRSFNRGTFLMLPSLKRRHRFNIKLQFATREKNALLFYNGRYNEEHDFIALEIINGQVQFSFSLGTVVTKVKAMVEGGVNDGNWHQVMVDYLNRTATLSIGEWCDTELVVEHGYRLGGYRCAARATKFLEENCADVTEICHRFLDLTGPFQLGGLPNLPAHFQAQNKDFEGCVRNVYLDNSLLDLNDYAYNNGTVQGCPQKQSFCDSSPCKNDGTCYEAWNSFRCECTSRHGGIDCTEDIDGPKRLPGIGFMEYSGRSIDDIRLPWYNGLSFRTKQDSALLMYIKVKGTAEYAIKLEMVDGYIHYIHPRVTVVLDSIRINDGDWHYIEAQWTPSDTISLSLDYGQSRTTGTANKDWISGAEIDRVLIGGLDSKNAGKTEVLQGLEGCVENIRLGNQPTSLLKNPRNYRTSPSCIIRDACVSNPCPAHSHCSMDFDDYRCTCHPGYVGKKCEPVCDKASPCKHAAKCQTAKGEPGGYTCQCPDYYRGHYCQDHLAQVCPAAWWGQPICGPCNCPKNKGFNPNCDKDTGTCSCRISHYQPLGSDQCFPCNCFVPGSVNGSCDPISGQCFCRPTVYGRRCDTCASKFAEVTRRGCEVLYVECPKEEKDGIEWKRTKMGQMVQTNCPKGTNGKATRMCHRETGWDEPNLFMCTSDVFLELLRENKEITHDQLEINTFVAKSLMSKLDTATGQVDNMQGSDINTTYSLISHILDFENAQSGLNLTHTQDRNFIQSFADDSDQEPEVTNHQKTHGPPEVNAKGHPVEVTNHQKTHGPPEVNAKGHPVEVTNHQKTHGPPEVNAKGHPVVAQKAPRQRQHAPSPMQKPASVTVCATCKRKDTEILHLKRKIQQLENQHERDTYREAVPQARLRPGIMPRNVAEENKNLVNSVGRITETKYKKLWKKIHQDSGGAVQLLEKLELYLQTLADNMQHVFTQPFDVVHSNMVLGLDYVVKSNNHSAVKVPKYNNKVQNSAMFDTGSMAQIPGANLKPSSMADMVTELVHKQKPRAVVSYILYKTIGDILPMELDSEIRRAPVPQVVNSAVFTLTVLDGDAVLKKGLKEPITLRLKQREVQNRTGAQCMFWQFMKSKKGPVRGQWSTDGCKKLDDATDENGERVVTCQCNHMTSFGVLMDVSSVELTAQPITIEVATYAIVSVALLCLMVAFVAFCCLRRTNSNANSIHMNLVFCIFVAYLIFVVGINWTDPKLLCKVIAIVLQYFFMCSFAWMFVEGVHLYRMMTDIRNIDQGTMPFYYTIGYVIPGIVVGLAVGLDTDSYGNEEFCWLKTSDLLIWSFAGPICVIMVLNIVVFFMTVRVSCRGKTAGDPEFSLLKNGLKAALVLVPLLGMAWVFALLAANDNVIPFQYLFAIFACLQGLFILLAHIVLNKRARSELKYTFHKMKHHEDSLSNTRTSMLSRSALAYHHNESSLEGGLNRVSVGISTNSTTSRSTSKSSGGMYHPDPYMHSSSTSTNMNIPSVKGYPPNAGIPPYGYDVSMFHQKSPDDPDTGERKRRIPDSDSDSEISAMEHSEMELASSHSSDDDDDDAYGLGKLSKGKSDSVQKPPPIPPIPVHSTPAPPYQLHYSPPPRQPWPGEVLSTSTISDIEKPAKHVTISDQPVHIPDNYVQGSRDKLLSPPRRVDSLPPKADTSDISKKSPKKDRIAVQVLTHNGSITSESEAGHETTV